MKSLQVIEEQEEEEEEEDRAIAHYNTVSSQLLKLVPRHQFETLANRHHEGRKLRKMARRSSP